MRVDVRPRGAVEVLDVTGPTAADRTAGTLGERVARLLEAGECLFLLNLSGQGELDCGSLGELVACRERVRRAGGVVKLVASADQREALAASGLAELFETFADEDEALDSFLGEFTTEGIP